MSIKNDRWIKQMALERDMIAPFQRDQVGAGVISYGVSSYGYDLRIGRDFKVFTPTYGPIIDPKNFSPKSFVEFNDVDYVDIPPNSFVLGVSMERFNIPRKVLTIVLGKSTYARCGQIVNCTPLEPEWQGYITLEISNTTPLPARIYAGEGIAQALFFESDESCDTSYADRKGQYQSQEKEVVTAKVRPVT